MASSESTENQDNSAPAQPSVVIGVGASAGGIAALKQFLSHATHERDAAYVVIVHLSPDYESHLAEVLQSSTALPVTQASGQTKLVAGHVYVIPPNAELALEDGHLQVKPVVATAAPRHPIDFFFRTLAETYGPRAIAIVLSGAGPDGSMGLKRVKENGGMVVVQEPQEAEYDEMPRSAIATGLVDYVLPVAGIGQAIRAYRHRLTHGSEPADVQAGDVSTLRDILTLLRVRTGHDFSNYKPATLWRRIDRRVHIHGLGDVRRYIQFLRERPEEVGLLLNELLISVTNFFRDPEAYSVLEQRIVPRLFDSAQGAEQIRVWAAGCATGEEAYSLAMVLTDYAAHSLTTPRIQVFGTDLDERAIGIAREGFYTEAEVADVSEDRLRRFFTRERSGFRVRRELRELVLFATHNVIKDPPFSHLDLIACRNLLIYLNRVAQERLLETFHFALRPGGFLFLGASESADASAELFAPLDKGAHIFESRSVANRFTPMFGEVPQIAGIRLAPPVFDASPSERMSTADLHLRLLEAYAPPSVVVTEEHNVLHISESAAQFLEITGGEPSRDLMKLLRPELRMDVRTALHQAARDRSTVTVQHVPLADGDQVGAVTITVRPARAEAGPDGRYFVVLFETEEGTERKDVAPVQLVRPTDAPISQLEQELGRVKSQLRATIEQYETHVEEAKAANEELQAMNEELRSAAEELETSKEELQSVNEELTTVNQELKLKIEELALTNNDLQNFINSTDIATIFLDRGLRLKLFTVRARDIFNLLPGDIGRPLSDITSTLKDGGLHDDLRTVLDRLQTIERPVQTEGNRTFLMRVLPYRTADDRIEGVVLTFLETDRGAKSKK